MQKKAFSMPIEPYLKKWLVNYRRFKKGIQVSGDFLFTNKLNRDSVYKYRNNKGLDRIDIYMRHADYVKAYFLHSYLQSMFDHDLATYAFTASRVGVSVQPALDEFLQKCKITEHEMKLETAYKRWQRYSPDRLPNIKGFTNDIQN